MEHGLYFWSERILVGLIVGIAFYRLFRRFVTKWLMGWFLGAYLEKLALHWLQQGKVARAQKLKKWVEKQGYLFDCCRP